VRNIGRFTVQQLLQSVIRAADAATNEVFLVFTRELAACDQKIGTVLAHGRTRPVAETSKPNEQVFLEFCSLLLAQLIVRNKGDVNQPERFAENRGDLFVEPLLR